MVLLVQAKNLNSRNPIRVRVKVRTSTPEILVDPAPSFT